MDSVSIYFSRDTDMERGTSSQNTSIHSERGVFMHTKNLKDTFNRRHTDMNIGVRKQFLSMIKNILDHTKRMSNCFCIRLSSS